MTSQPPHDGAGGPRNTLLKSPFDFAGGLFLLAVGALGLAGGYNLPLGTLSGIGSGLLPRVVALLVAGFGVLLIIHAFLFAGSQLEKWQLRGPMFVLGAVLVFAVLIRGSTLTLGGFAGIPALASVKVPPMGLIVAGPLAVVVASMADKETRPTEIVVFAVVMTLLSGILFKELLGLPIPFDPAGLVPESVNHAYAGAKSAIGHAIVGVKKLFVS
jgi:hypothetical protein